MPIQRCTKNGKSGYRYGKSGTCYTGPGAREKALKQMRAIKAQGEPVETRRDKLLRQISEVLRGKSENSLDN